MQEINIEQILFNKKRATEKFQSTFKNRWYSYGEMQEKSQLVEEMINAEQALARWLHR